MAVVLVLSLASAAFADVKANKEYTIAFSLKTVTNDAFQQAIAEAVETEATAAGCKFQLVTAGSETGVSTQVNQLEDLITAGVDALVVNPMDANAVIPALQKAHDKGIPVVLVDSTIEGNEDLYITYIGTDNYAAAEIGAQVLSEALGGTGKVILVRGANGNSVGNARADGYKAGLAEGVELVGEQPGDWSNDVAKQVTENMLCVLMATGMVSWLRQNIIFRAKMTGLKDKIRADGDSIDLIKEGLVLGTMAQFPKEMGKLAVETLVQVLNGEKTEADFEKYTDSGTACYTLDNLPE